MTDPKPIAVEIPCPICNGCIVVDVASSVVSIKGAQNEVECAVFVGQPWCCECGWRPEE